MNTVTPEASYQESWQTQGSNGSETSRPSKIPALLRAFGAMAVLFSLYTFLFKGWDGGNDVVRYLMLLSHTGLLSLIALASGHFFKEGKSPRLLMMLALVSVPVNCAILGGFIFFGYNTSIAGNYPSFVTWTIDGLNTALLLSAAAMVILVPTILLAFKTLTRGLSSYMTIMFILNNLVLLLPIRTPNIIFAIAIAAGIVTLYIASKTAHKRTEAKTFEGMIALLIQFLPTAIIFGRSVWLYSPDAVLIAGITAMLFALTRNICLQLEEQGYLRMVLEMISSLLTIATGTAVFGALNIMTGSEVFSILIGAAVTSGMLYELSMRSCGLNSFYRAAAVLFFVGNLLIQYFFVDGFQASLINLLFGVTFVAVGFQTKKQSLFICGASVLLVSIIYQISLAFSVFQFSYWIWLALLGVLAIVFASMIESKGFKIKHLFCQYQMQYSRWDF